MPEEKTPDPKAIEETVGKLDKFVQYVIGVLSGKNWTTKLLLLDVLLFTVFNPVFFPKILELFGVKELPNHYARYFWLVIGAVFVAAVVAAWRTRPKEKPLRDLSESRAIRGLLPYTKDDAALFARLQREHDLTECLLAISDPSFRFGVLSGESGAGKSSFLQAGLWAEFEKRKLRCVYVKFIDLDPFESVKRACLKHLSLPDGIADDADFLCLLEAAARQDSAPIVLLFDQFEQFFVHRKRKKDREPFVQALSLWFARMQSSPVKILLCIRGDFLDRLNELQKAMRYSLSPAQSFRLERFEPDQATEVFCFLAEKESLEYDRKFISEMTRQELAGTEDGLISPVDIQVLAWMIAGQPVRDGRAFNRTTFQKLGGVDGLLERYLTRALAVRETEARRQAAIKVLLALTDLERNARAGALTLEALRQKLGGDINDAEMKEAVAWLARSDVRLILPSSESEEEKFELAHERLIPALRRLAGKELTETDRVNQLLDRRFNEWLGNDRSRRYLLTWRELRRVSRQIAFLIWGSQKNAKELFISKSRWRVRQWQVSTSIPVVAGLCLLLAYYSTWGQLYLVRLDLQIYASRVKDKETLADIAIAYLAERNFTEAHKLTAQITDSSALGSVIKAHIEMGDTGLARSLLEQAYKNVGNIKYGVFRNNAFCSMAEAYILLGESGKAEFLLEQVLKDVEKSSLNEEKYRTLSTVGEIYIKLGNVTRGTLLLEQARQGLEQVRQNTAKTFGTSDARYAFLGLNVHSEDSEVALIAEAASKHGDVALLHLALEKAESLPYQYNVVIPIAKASVKLKEVERGAKLIERAKQQAEAISDSYTKVIELSSVAEAYLTLNDREQAIRLLDQALQSADTISRNETRVDAIKRVAECYIKLKDTKRVVSLLRQATQNTAKIPDAYSRGFYLASIAIAYIKLGDAKLAAPVLELAFRNVERNTSEDLKGYVLNEIVRGASKLRKIKLARDAALLHDNDKDIAKALAIILKTWANRNNPNIDDDKDEWLH